MYLRSVHFLWNHILFCDRHFFCWNWESNSEQLPLVVLNTTFDHSAAIIDLHSYVNYFWNLRSQPSTGPSSLELPSPISGRWTGVSLGGGKILHFENVGPDVQCDQTSRLLLPYLAIYNNENYPNSIRHLPK